MKYREPLPSKLIYIIRHSFLVTQNTNKRLKKIWKQKNEYFTALYWRERRNRKRCKRNEKILKRTNENYVHKSEEQSNSSKLSCRLAVYTCIFGPYDTISEPLYKSSWCDYFIITDQEIPTNSIWKKINPPVPDGFYGWPNAVKNRYYKMHPDVLFSTYKYSLYVDGNIKLLTDMYPFVQQLGNTFIGIYKYPLSDCFYDNAIFLESLGLVASRQNSEQIQSYSNEGFPHHFGYFECGFIVREHNHPLCKQLMDTWWEQYCIWVKRDQQSLPYALWKNGLTKNSVACLGKNVRKTERITFREHKEEHRLVTWEH